MRAVVAALELQHTTPARHAARDPDGVHGGLGARVGEPDAIELEAAVQLFGQIQHESVRHAEHQPA